MSSADELDHLRRTYRVDFPSVIDSRQVIAWFRQLGAGLHAASTRKHKPSIAFETIGTAYGTTHYITVPWQDAEHVVQQLHGHIQGISANHVETGRIKRNWTYAAEYHLDRPDELLPLGEDAKTRWISILNSMHDLNDNDEIMLQWIVRPIPHHKLPRVPQRRESHFSISSLQFQVRETDKNYIDRRAAKNDEPNFAVSLRIAAYADSDVRAQYLVHNLSLRVGGDRGFHRDNAIKQENLLHGVYHASSPRYYINRLTASELAALVGFPLGNESVIGVSREATRQRPPSASVLTSRSPLIENDGGIKLGSSTMAGRESVVGIDYVSLGMHAMITGATGCLHPDTPIYDPVDDSTRTVFERFKTGKSFHVFSMDASGRMVIALADAPKKYRRVGMYRLFNDSHSIIVTGQHRVWVGDRYVTLDELRASSEVRLPSISEHDLSRLRADALRLKRTLSGSRDDCRSSHHLYGQRPQSASDSDRVSSPSPNDADAPYCSQYGMDDRARKRGCSRPHQQPDQISKSSSVRHASLGHGSSRHVHQDTASSVGSRAPSSLPLVEHLNLTDRAGQPRLSWLQSTSITLLGVALRHIPDTRLRRSIAKYQASALFDSATCQLDRASLSPVQLNRQDYSDHLLFSSYSNHNSFEVQREEDEVYYDFHVPVYENYLACGLIHHNTGKTSEMSQIARQAMEHGHGLIIIDPKMDLFHAVIDDVPPSRRDDVIVIDFMAPGSVGFNILEQGNPHTVIDELVDLFEYKYGDKGVYFRQIMYHGLRTIAATPGLTFNDLRALISPENKQEENWARRISGAITDREVRRFWDNWWSDPKRGDNSKSTVNRIWQLTSRPETRYMLGQSKSSFFMDDVIKDNKILLVNVAGVADETKELIGTLLFNAAWTSAQNMQPKLSNLVMMDEFQMFADIPFGFDEVLALGRKFKFSVIAACQYPDQLDRKMQQAVLNHARSKIVLNSEGDTARFWARFFANGITDSDIGNLPEYVAMTRLKTPDGMSPPFTMKTLKPLTPYGSKMDVARRSAEKYSRKIIDIQAEEDTRRGMGRRRLSDEEAREYLDGR